jgi:hypothetical protein
MLLADTSAGLIAAYTVSAIVHVAIIVATVVIAVRKGHSGILFFIFSLFCSLIALIVALVMQPRPGYPRA